MSKKVTVELQISMPKSKLGSALLSVNIDAAEAFAAIGAGNVTTDTLERYVRQLIADNFKVKITNARDATTAVRAAQRK